MGRPLVLHPFVPGLREADQRPTRMALAASGLPVVDVPTPPDQPLAYAAALRRWWWAGAGPLLVCEQDKEPTPAALAGLLSCSHPWCAVAYPIYPAQTLLPAPVMAAGAFRPDGSLRWLQEPEDWADTAGLGLCRFQGAARTVRPPLVPFGPQFDAQVAARLRAHGLRCHVHWPPIAHRHG